MWVCACICFSQGGLSLSNRMKLALMKHYPSETRAHSHAKLVDGCNTHVLVMCVHRFVFNMCVV